MASLTLSFADAAALRAIFVAELSKGRAFVPGPAAVGELESCDLVLEQGGRIHKLRGEAVFVKAEGLGCGVGLQLAALDPVAREALRAFVEGASGPPMLDSAASDETGEPSRLHDRIRALSAIEQQRLAAAGTMSERVALERTFGANVWEALLANSRLMMPEVATIARKGTLPRPLVENIAGHPAWIAAPEVQRALLSNPRASVAVIAKVLQGMSRRDLQLVPQQAAYPQGVRAAAKKLLGK